MGGTCKDFHSFIFFVASEKTPFCPFWTNHYHSLQILWR
ncbi:hypothetical protein ECSTEC7V_3358 [Escherichia coli STEC_7v]|nr:hypothetical protein ECSTEC7V_3358 [Escherichia coli STEC_7v]